MKTSTIVIIVFAILVAIGIGVKLLKVQADDTIAFTLPDEISTGKVLSIQHYTLKQGVDPQEFERFVVEEWSPVIRDIWPGIQIMVMKGERGSHVGKYIIALEMNSLYVRNFYFPTTGELSEAANAIWENCGEPCVQLRNRFQELAERTEWTDYAALVKK